MVLEGKSEVCERPIPLPSQSSGYETETQRDSGGQDGGRKRHTPCRNNPEFLEVPVTMGPPGQWVWFQRYPGGDDGSMGASLEREVLGAKQFSVGR